MPYQIKKLHHLNLYKVINKTTGVVHSKHTSLLKAKAQVRHLQSKERSDQSK